MSAITKYVKNLKTILLLGVLVFVFGRPELASSHDDLEAFYLYPALQPYFEIVSQNGSPAVAHKPGMKFIPEKILRQILDPLLTDPARNLLHPILGSLYHPQTMKIFYGRQPNEMMVHEGPFIGSGTLPDDQEPFHVSFENETAEKRRRDRLEKAHKSANESCYCLITEIKKINDVENLGPELNREMRKSQRQHESILLRTKHHHHLQLLRSAHARMNQHERDRIASEGISMTKLSRMPSFDAYDVNHAELPEELPSPTAQSGPSSLQTNHLDEAGAADPESSMTKFRRKLSIEIRDFSHLEIADDLPSSTEQTAPQHFRPASVATTRSFESSGHLHSGWLDDSLPSDDDANDLEFPQNLSTSPQYDPSRNDSPSQSEDEEEHDRDCSLKD